MAGRHPSAASRLAEALAPASRIVAFTGAGISTESGIPDFRSPGGIWSRMQPIQFGDFIRSAEVRREAWRRRFEGERTIEAARPNRGHRALAHLHEQGRLHALITQNVDDLHRVSGIPADHVIELHGNATWAHCLACGLRQELADLEVQWRRNGDVAPCPACGGIIKSATISFGQAMPVRAMERAEQATLECDLFLVIGSSLVVHPAAGFPELAARRGARLVILNREPTPLDPLADLVLHDEIGPTLGAAVGVN